MDPNLWSSIVRKSPTWKPEDYESLDALKQFCLERRAKIDSGRLEGAMFVIWPNVAYAVWGALRAREARKMPREPSFDEVNADQLAAVRSLDEVIRWCDSHEVATHVDDHLADSWEATPETDDAARTEEQTEPATVEYHVTLWQMAAIVSKSKKTLERLRKNEILPAPDVKGGNGKANEWRWSKVRPILEKEYWRKLPEVFPADQFVRK